MFLVAYVTFEPLSAAYLTGVQRSRMRLEAADGQGTRLAHDLSLNLRPLFVTFSVEFLYTIWKPPSWCTTIKTCPASLVSSL